MENCRVNVGKKVAKHSGKPFKSTFKVNTVRGVIDHPERVGHKAYTFYEDTSYVSVDLCYLVQSE